METNWTHSARPLRWMVLAGLYLAGPAFAQDLDLGFVPSVRSRQVWCLAHGGQVPRVEGLEPDDVAHAATLHHQLHQLHQPLEILQMGLILVSIGISLLLQVVRFSLLLVQLLTS